MQKAEAIKLLNKLYEQGFEVLQLKQEGTRIWPNKEFRLYADKHRENQHPSGQTGYVAKKKFLNLLIFTKTAAISIKLDNNGIVIESEGRINTDSI